MSIQKAEILCVGTELLLGDIVNTNAAYIARGLAKIGIGVFRSAVVGDNAGRLAEDLTAALSRSELVVLSGGLGPTEDDITKEVAAAVFGRNLALHEPSLARIKSYFASAGRVMSENNVKQAMMPEGATVFPNDHGTAPALALMREDGRIAVLLPGPPRELEPLFEEQVVPFLRRYTDAVLVSRNLHICGMGESAVEAALPHSLFAAENPTAALYCAPGEVRLRLTAKAADEETARALCQKAIEGLESTPVWGHIYGIDVASPEAALIELLQARGCSVATAESCTGGLVAKRLTDVAGCSAVVAGGMVTYQTREKIALLGVPGQIIDAHTVVSEQVAREMAERVREKMKVDVGIATTGYAGPGGGTEQDPVGTVYIAVATANGTTVRRLSLSHRRDRAYIREVAATTALCDAVRVLRDLTNKS